MERAVKFKNTKGLNLAGIINETGDKNWIVILAHGFTQHKNAKSFVSLSEMLFKRGISTFRFDFFGHGDSEGNFEEITMTQALDDLKNAVNYIKKLGYKNIGLLGSSFGGFAAIIFASKSIYLKFLALRSPVSDYQELGKLRYSDKELADWEKRGFRDYETGGGVIKKLNFTFVKDMTNYDAYIAAEKIKIPTLIVHGDRDFEVPYRQSQKLAKLIKSAKLVTIKGANHRYTDEKHAKQMINTIYKFLLSNILHS